MKAKTDSPLLTDLEVSKSHSRPHLPDDNPYSEAHFKTVKYHPTFPDRFVSPDAARTWARAFFTWYNHDFYHSSLALLTPTSVHYGQADLILSHHFPAAGQAQEAPVVHIGNCPAGDGREIRVVSNPPQEYMGVKEQP